MHLSCFCLLGITLGAVAAAQPSNSGKRSPTSTVSGHIFCADTNGPARLATVVLEPASALDNQKPKTPHEDAASIETVHMTSVQTLPDGSFALKGVSPGAYYVVVSSPGYVSSLSALGFSDDDFKALDESAKKRVRTSLPRVVVEADLPATIDVTLERGAAVSGTVLYDDGSPAAGISIALLIRNMNAAKDSKQAPWAERAHPPAGGGEMGASTDDRGNFRISALPAHEYILMATLEVSKSDYMVRGSSGMSVYGSRWESVPIYSGDKMRMKDAVQFTVKLGEERTGEDVQIPLTKLRKVSGNITAAHDGHIVNAGTVRLLYADDKTEFANTALTHEDPGFAFDLVPDGDYVLRVTDAADANYTEAQSKDNWAPPRFDVYKEHTYDAADEPLHVDADASGITIAVPEKHAAAPASSTATNP